MKTNGFTLIELLIVILIFTILAASAIPSFKQVLQNTHTQTAKSELLNAIDQTRAKSVFSGSRSVLKAKGEWHDGWQVFLDQNDDGIASSDEPILIDQGPIDGVTIKGNESVRNLISFISTGEGRQPGAANRGAFITGTLTICPLISGKGYQLVLSRGGRTRVQDTEPGTCP